MSTANSQYSNSKRAAASRRNGAKSKGPTSDTGKRNSSKNSFKTGLNAQTVEAFPKLHQEHYHQIFDALRLDYCPKDPIEDDLLSQLAFNRVRYHQFIQLESQALASAGLSNLPVSLLEHLRRTLDSLERSYSRTLKTLEDRRHKSPQLAQPNKLIIQWIDPRTGKPWRYTEEESGAHLKNQTTNPPTTTKPRPALPPAAASPSAESKTYESDILAPSAGPASSSLPEIEQSV